MEKLMMIMSVLNSQNIHTYVLNNDERLSIDLGLRNSLYNDFDSSLFINEFKGCHENKIYYFTDIFNLNYLVLKIPGEMSYVCAGPYSFKVIDESVYNELEIHCHLPSAKKKELLSYFIAIPYIHSSANWYSLVNALASFLYDNDDLEVVFKSFEFEKQIESFSYKEEIASKLKIQLIEGRYNNENELMHSISIGDIKQSLKLLNIRQQNKLEPRSPDPIRDCKNYLFVQNTLFRKAIEQGGVLPYYLDEISTKYAKIIETVISVDHSNYIGVEMAKEYCQMVLDHAHPNYSPLIKSVVSYIEVNLSEPLSLKYLSRIFNISDAYFSTLFKKETGITLTNYIQKLRMKEASRYLKESDFKVIDIASIVGIPDLNYFIKLFKKYYKMTPTQYRQLKG